MPQRFRTSLNEIVVANHLAISGDPIKDHDVSPAHSVKSVGQLVDEDPIILEKRGLHARSRDVELLEDECPNGQRNDQSRHDDDEPLTYYLERRFRIR